MEKKDFYNYSEVYYDVLKNEPAEYYNEFIQFVKYYLKDEQDMVLDVGCGTGQSTYYLKEVGYRPIGYDFSDRYIQHAKKNYPEIEFQQGAVEKMPFSDNKFFGVVTYNSIEHFDDVAESISEMKRVLKPGGLLIIQAPNLLSPKLPLAAIKQKGQTFAGRKNLIELIWMTIQFSIMLLLKSILKRGQIRKRKPNYNFSFPDNDATNYANPIDIKVILEKMGMSIISYQKFNHTSDKKSFWRKILANLFPSAMSIIRIVARKKQIRIAFVNITNTGSAIPPLGALSIASYLIKKEEIGAQDIKFIDANIHNVKNSLLKFEPDIVFISAMTISYDDAVRLTKWINRKISHSYVIIGGVHISTAPQSLNKAFTVGIIGEGEETSLELYKHYKKNKKFIASELYQIQGLAFWDNNKLAQTNPRPLIENLEMLPKSDWSLLGDEYFPMSPVVIDNKLLIVKCGNILTSRGCPFKCVFCSTSVFWQKLRLFAVAQTVAEIEWLYHNRDIYVFNIWDDMFAVSKDRIKQFIETLGEKGLLGKIKFNIQARTNVIDEEMCQLFVDLGVFSVGFGFESGSKKVLSYLKKNNCDPADHKKAVELLDKRNIKINGSFMLGNPNETKADLQATIDLMTWMSKVKNVDRLWYGLTTPYPGTELWDCFMQESKQSIQWKRLDILHTRFSKKVPKPFFTNDVSRKDFIYFWQQADKIIIQLESLKREMMPEIYQKIDEFENNSVLNRFKKMTYGQKIQKVLYKPGKAFKVIFLFFKKTLIK